MQKKIALKAMAFLLLFSVLLAGVSKILVSHEDYRNYHWIAGFYEERENSLDAVYIGGSNAYAFWLAPLAWENYGITVYPFACNDQPLEAAKHMIIEARKTQPDAVYIVSISNIRKTVTEQQIHYLADYFPNSANKFDMIQTLSDIGGFSTSERMEFYFPLLRYHSRWSKLRKEDFHYSVNGLKGGSNYSLFLEKTKDVSKDFSNTQATGEIYSHIQSALEDLLDYCDEEEVQVLFVTAPQSLTDTKKIEQMNAINEFVASRGYPVLNMIEQIEKIGLDLTKDYYNGEHTNVHGAIKVTDYFSQYLIANYNFENKKGRSDYQDWDIAYEKYIEEITPYISEDELVDAN